MIDRDRSLNVTCGVNVPGFERAMIMAWSAVGYKLCKVGCEWCHSVRILCVDTFFYGCTFIFRNSYTIYVQICIIQIVTVENFQKFHLFAKARTCSGNCTIVKTCILFLNH